MFSAVADALPSVSPRKGQPPPYRASHAGAGRVLLGGSDIGGGGVAAKRAGAPWFLAERHVSLAQVVAGLAVLALSVRFLYQFTETTGLLLGGLLVTTGALGLAGGARRSTNLVNAQLVASIVGVLLAFQLMGEVARDAQVDCALAELHQRARATERAVDGARQAEAMRAVFSRLGELEDQLSAVQGGAAWHAELRREQEGLRATDVNYVRAKVEMVRRHAEEVLDSVLKNEAVSAGSVARMGEGEKAALRARLDAADRVMARVARAHVGEDAGAALSFEEYREVLGALTDAGALPDRAAHPELQQALRELPNMQAAMRRQAADAYDSILFGRAGAELSKAAAARRARRDAWEGQFGAQLAAAQAGGRDYVADLPEHCVRETAGERAVAWAGAAVVALQLAAAYVALSLAFRLPVKGE